GFAREGRRGGGEGGGKAEGGRGGEGGARVAERGGWDGGAAECRHASAVRSKGEHRRGEHHGPGARARTAARGKAAAARRARLVDRAARVAGWARQSWARAGRGERFAVRFERQSRPARAPGAFDLVANRLSRSERGDEAARRACGARRVRQ